METICLNRLFGQNCYRVIRIRISKESDFKFVRRKICLKVISVYVLYNIILLGIYYIFIKKKKKIKKKK